MGVVLNEQSLATRRAAKPKRQDRNVLSLVINTPVIRGDTPFRVVTIIGGGSMVRDDMLSSLARGPEGADLVEFFRANSVPLDWGDVDDYSVDGMVSGNKLSNAVGNVLQLGGNQLNSEYLVHLRGPSGECTVNLATVLAMAAAYCRNQQNMAEEAMVVTTVAAAASSKKPRKRNGRQRPPNTSRNKR